MSSAFWDDHQRDLEDPGYRHHFVLESQRIAAIDAVINQLNELREEQDISKAALARAIERDPAAVRRILTAKSVNPTLALVADLAAVLGYRVVLAPMSAQERRDVTAPLREAALA